MPRSRYSCWMSRMRTSWPWRAESSAMPWPISPAPITAIFIETRPPPWMVRAELKVWPRRRETLYPRAPCPQCHDGPPRDRGDRNRDRRRNRCAVRGGPGDPRAKRRLQSPERIRPRHRVGVLLGDCPRAGDRERVPPLGDESRGLAHLPRRTGGCCAIRLLPAESGQGPVGPRQAGPLTRFHDLRPAETQMKLQSLRPSSRFGWPISSSSYRTWTTGFFVFMTP